MRKILFTALFIILVCSNVNAYDFTNPNVSGATVEHLNDIFANATDGEYLCEDMSKILKFPNDTGFEGCVRKHIKNDRWPLSCVTAREITNITCDNPFITSLEGVQQFPNLQTLIISGNGSKIEDLAPIRNLTKLIRVEIPNSNISDFAFLSALNNLQYLDLSRNHVTDLQYLAYLPNLQNLSLEYEEPNYISDITPIRFLRHLRNLSLQGNKVTDISPLGEAGGIEYLNIRDNRIGSLAPLSNLPNLAGFNASINMINDLSPLANLTKLSSVSINSNRINNMDVLRGLPNLSYVSLIGNAITDISPVADKRKIKSISLDYNSITDLTPIYSIMIYADLTELGLAYNCIPADNYEKIKYLKDISQTRFGHQCEAFDPKDAVPDISFVVNGDLVGAEDLGVNEVKDGDKTIVGVGGGGCSATPLSSKIIFLDIIYAFAIISFFVKYLIDKLKKSA